MTFLVGYDLEGSLYGDNLTFSETPQLCSHNAFAAVEYGWDTHPMQYDGILGQFNNGARCFMIDVHEGADGELVLVHNKNIKAIAGIGSSSNAYYQPFHFKTILEQVHGILKANDKAVISLIIENKGVPQEKVSKSLKALEYLMLDSNPNEKSLTFGQMRNSKKRLVVFAEEGNYTIPNIFSTDFYKETTFSLGEDKKCLPRDKNRPRADFKDPKVGILVLNHFYKFSCSYDDDPVSIWGYIKHPCSEVNSAEEIHNRIALCKNEHNLKPTFFALDFIEKGKNGGGLKVIYDLMKSNFNSSNNDLVGQSIISPFSISLREAIAFSVGSVITAAFMCICMWRGANGASINNNLSSSLNSIKAD